MAATAAAYQKCINPDCGTELDCASVTDGFRCPEIITDGVNGYLFRPRDVEGLTEKVLLAASSLRLGRKARETIVRRFSPDEGVRRYLDLYRELSPRS